MTCVACLKSTAVPIQPRSILLWQGAVRAVALTVACGKAASMCTALVSSGQGVLPYLHAGTLTACGSCFWLDCPFGDAESHFGFAQALGRVLDQPAYINGSISCILRIASTSS